MNLKKLVSNLKNKLLMKYSVFAITFFLCSSCYNNSDSQYIISKENSRLKGNLSNDVGNLKYGHFNFILSDDKKVFVHTKNNLDDRNDVIDYSTKLLPFLNLIPNDITIIESSKIVDYIERNIKDSIKLESNQMVQTYITISSKFDTINNADFFVLKKQLIKQHANYFYVRKITEEESQVILSIKNNIPYDPKSIQWKTKFKESSKIMY